jgi:hypothetical protein
MFNDDFDDEKHAPPQGAVIV